MSADNKSNINLFREEAFEKIQSNPTLSCKLKREAGTCYETKTAEQKVRGEYDVFKDFQTVAFFFLRSDSPPRNWFIRLVTWPYFERLSIFVILVNCVTLGLYDPSDPDCHTQRCQTLDTMEKVIYVFFLIEMLCKWMAMGLFGKMAYFNDPWNRLDCFIVAAGTFELIYNEGEYLSAVRAIRVLRPLRAINRVPSIRILVTLLLDTLPMLWNVLAICFFIFAIFGIVAVQLWGGVLRGRCFIDDRLPKNVSQSYNLSNFYEPSFDNPDFVCALPDVPGMQKCTSEFITPLKHENGGQCSLTYEESLNKSLISNHSNDCVDWHQYYRKCKQEGDNPAWGAIGFDNIFIAWVAIFQVITLEGWADIMYFVQDAHGFWNWIYFVILIVIASYFMTNLCLVVITTQFQETKQRENELLRASRRREGTSTSTIASSRYGKDGCWIEILKYIEHLFKRLKRRFQKRFNWKYCEDSNKRTRISKRRKRRKRKKKLVYHHHHHHHHHHHYHHHVYCTDPGCQPSNVLPGALNLTPNASCVDVQQSQGKQDKANTNRLTVPGQELSNGEQDSIGRPGEIPTISIITGSTCSVRKEPTSSSQGEMITTATAAVAVNGRSAAADIAAHTFLSAASLSSAAATATASAAAASAIHNVCTCAVEHVEEDIKVDYESECVYEESEESENELTDNEEAGDTSQKKTQCKRFRQLCRRNVDSKWFMYIIMGSIFFNTLSMGIEYHGQPSKMTEVLEILNYIFTAIFGLEMFLKLLGLGPYGYIKDPFNLFDGFIVIMSIVELFGDGNSSISVLRSFRLLRIFKLVRFLPALRRQLMVMIHTMDNVMTFLALLALFIFTASILGMNLFGGKYSFETEEGEYVTARANFDDLFWALVTVFQVLTQEDWNTVMYDGMRATSKWAALYFILLMTIGNYILFNLLVAILVEGFANQPEKTASTLSIKSKGSKQDESYVACKDVSPPYENPSSPQAPSLVCVSPMRSSTNVESASAHNQKTRNDETSAPMQRLRCSFPSLSPRCSMFRDECHVSAPASPTRISPRVTRKALSFGDTTTMVIVNPAKAERCITTDDEMSAREDDETEVRIQDSSSCCYQRTAWALYIFSPSNKFRKLMIALYTNKWFDRVVLTFILLNCVVMALEKPDLPDDSELQKFINICMYIFLGIFTLEMLIKVIALGLWVGPGAYLRSTWNVMDGFLVVVSWIDVIVTLTTNTESSILGVLRVFRALRTLRPLRVISRAPGLKVVVETLITSLKPIGNIVLIAATFFIIFGILGVQLFKGKFYYCAEASDVNSRVDCLSKGHSWINKEYNFDNLAKALLTLFVFSTKDGWVTIMYDGIDAVGVDKQPIRNYNKWNVLYFVAFLLLAGFVVLNMLVGVVVENFKKCRDIIEKDRLAEKEKEKEQEKAKKRQAEADKEEAEEFLQPRRIFHRICTHGYFDLGISAVIVLNVICMAMEHYKQPQEMSDFLEYANYVFTAIFILEGVLKIYALGFKKYIKERWNQLDLIIILLSIVGIVLEEMDASLPINPTIIRVMRVLRIARVLKLLKTAEGIRKLLDTVAEALPQVGNLGLLFLLMFFIFAALGMELFGEINCSSDDVPCEGLDHHAHFKNFGFAMLTLFRVSTGDNWNGILKDIINEKRCAKDPPTGCSALEHIAPIYFAIFVLATQFVLLNVVVAVLMKHLEDAKEEISVTSSREGELENKLATKTDGNGDQDSCKDGQRNQGESVPERGANNNARAAIPAQVGLDRQGPNDSESSLSSFEYAVRSQPVSASSRHRLPPMNKTQSNWCANPATLRLPPIGSQSRAINKIGRSSEKVDSLTSGLPSPESEKSDTKSSDGHISPRAPIYVMSEDSTEIYDSNMEVDREPSKVFRPVNNCSATRSQSPHSSSEEEGQKKFFKKPFRKSDPKRAKSSGKRESKTTARVLPIPNTEPDKQEIKPVKPDARWATPAFSGVQPPGMRKDNKLEPSVTTKKDEDKSYEMQSYV